MYNLIPNNEFSDIYQINQLNWLVSTEGTIDEEFEDIISYGINYIDQIIRGTELIEKSTQKDFTSYNLLSNSSLQSLDRIILTLQIFSTPEEKYPEVKNRITNKVSHLKELLEEVAKTKVIVPGKLSEVKDFFKELLTLQINMLNKSNKMLKVL